MKCKKFFPKLLIFAILIFTVLLLFSNLALADIGLPHFIYGKLLNADGSCADKADLDIYAYIPERPGEILDKASTGCGYALDSFSDGWLWFEVGNFFTPWAINENIRLIVVNNLLYETGAVDLVLDSSGNQLFSDLYLASGDNVGPLTLNAMVDDTNPASIPEGTNNVILTAIVNDSISGNSDIQSAEYYIDVDPGFGSGVAMQPSDGLFDSPQEGVITSIDTSSLVGVNAYTIFVRGQDSAGNWGLPHMVNLAVMVLEKALLEGPEQIGIVLPEPTRYVFEIFYWNANQTSPVRINDTVPAEFEIVNIVPSIGEVNYYKVARDAGNSANRIEWDLAVDQTEGSLIVEIQTVESLGEGHSETVFKPTSCGPLTINDGATAYEVDPETGEIVMKEVKKGKKGQVIYESVVIIGPSNSFQVEAVEGAKPCEEKKKKKK